MQRLRRIRLHLLRTTTMIPIRQLPTNRLVRRPSTTLPKPITTTPVSTRKRIHLNAQYQIIRQRRPNQSPLTRTPHEHQVHHMSQAKRSMTIAVNRLSNLIRDIRSTRTRRQTRNLNIMRHVAQTSTFRSHQIYRPSNIKVASRPNPQIHKHGTASTNQTMRHIVVHSRSRILIIISRMLLISRQTVRRINRQIASRNILGHTGRTLTSSIMSITVSPRNTRQYTPLPNQARAKRRHALSRRIRFNIKRSRRQILTTRFRTQQLRITPNRLPRSATSINQTNRPRLISRSLARNTVRALRNNKSVDSSSLRRITQRPPNMRRLHRHINSNHNILDQLPSSHITNSRNKRRMPQKRHNQRIHNHSSHDHTR